MAAGSRPDCNNSAACRRDMPSAFAMQRSKELFVFVTALVTVGSGSSNDAMTQQRIENRQRSAVNGQPEYLGVSLRNACGRSRSQSNAPHRFETVDHFRRVFASWQAKHRFKKVAKSTRFCDQF